MKIYFATWLEEPSQERSLTKRKAYNRLLSYSFLRQRKQIEREIHAYLHGGHNYGNRERED